MNNPIIMHINYAERAFNTLSMSVDEICQKAVEWGFDGVEFRARLPIGFEDVDAYLKAIAEAKKKSGLKMVMFGYGVNGCSDPDEAVRAKAVEDAVAFFKKAKELCGTTVCNAFGDGVQNPEANGNYNLMGSMVATEEQWKNTAETFKKVGAECEKIGMKLAFETHMVYIHDTPKPARKLVDMIDSPAVGVNMDYGNTVYFINIPTVEETIDIYGDKLFYTHLKNSSSIGGNRFPTALSDGEINHRLYLKKLADVGYNGPIGIEAPRGGDRQWFVRQDIAYFKQTAKEVGLLK